MMRIFLPLLVLLASFGCDKPTEDQCRKAVANIRRITGTSQSDFGADPQAAIRSCRGNASKESVLCMIEAKTVDDIKKCEGEKGARFMADEEKAEQKKREEWQKKQNEKGEGGDEQPEPSKEEAPKDGE